MITFDSITTENKYYPFVEELLHSSFPEVERREDEEQRAYTDEHPLFACYLICDEKIPIGVITVWQLNGFHYLEHLAISPTLRSKGYGQLVIETIKRKLAGTIVLEVELPEDELSTRRIGFYQRCGFSLCQKPYLQPPYREGDAPLPMHLMFTGTKSIDENFESIRDCIHKYVYGVGS